MSEPDLPLQSGADLLLKEPCSGFLNRRRPSYPTLHPAPTLSRTSYATFIHSSIASMPPSWLPSLLSRIFLSTVVPICEPCSGFLNRRRPSYPTLHPAPTLSRMAAVHLSPKPRVRLRRRLHIAVLRRGRGTASRRLPQRAWFTKTHSKKPWGKPMKPRRRTTRNLLRALRS